MKSCFFTAGARTDDTAMPELFVFFFLQYLQKISTARSEVLFRIENSNNIVRFKQASDKPRTVAIKQKKRKQSLHISLHFLLIHDPYLIYN